jgi:PAS domain S-box-containing protein
VAAENVHPGTEGHTRSSTAPEAGDPALLIAAVEELPIGLIVARADGRVAWMNRHARELLGADVVGLDLLEIEAPHAIDASGAAMPMRTTALARSLLDAEVVEESAVDVLRADGTHVSVSSATTPLRDASGAIVGAAAVFVDSTELHRRERAEREFIANAAHELRTPLAAIASAIDVLRSGAKEQPAERDLFLDHIARESDRLQRLARALLLIARADVQQETPRVEIVPLEPLLVEIAESLRPGTGVEVFVRCHEDLAVLANRDLLEQAVLNITANAVRYTENGSITLVCHAEDEAAVIEVRDTGTGIPQAESSRVFERFYRAGRRDSQGFGLGLSIARNAIEAIGGRIALESAEGAGTSVEIRLPLATLVPS